VLGAGAGADFTAAGAGVAGALLAGAGVWDELGVAVWGAFVAVVFAGLGVVSVGFAVAGVTGFFSAVGSAGSFDVTGATEAPAEGAGFVAGTCATELGAALVF